MAVSVDSAGPLIDMVFRRMKPLRDALLLAGLYYTSRVALKGTFTFYQAVKTFALPLIWPRNFSKEYGKWAGMHEQVKYLYLYRIILIFLKEKRVFENIIYSILKLFSYYWRNKGNWKMLCQRNGQTRNEYFADWQK